MSTADELVKLDALRKSDVLTQEEFDAEKGKLLAQPVNPAPTVVAMSPVDSTKASGVRTGISETPSPTTTSEDGLRPIPIGWEWVLIAAGALVAIGSLLPWEQATTGFVSITRNGFQLGADLSFSADGLVVMVLGVIVALIGITRLTSRSFPQWLNGSPIVLGAVILVFGIVDGHSLANTVNGLRSSYSAGAYSVGYGVWLVIAGGAIIALAGLLGRVGNAKTTDRLVGSARATGGPVRARLPVCEVCRNRLDWSPITGYAATCKYCNHFQSWAFLHAPKADGAASSNHHEEIREHQQGPSVTTQTSIPELFPLELQSFPVFADDGKLRFGWDQRGFYIIHRSIGWTRTLHRFPLTPDGWKAAWETMSSNCPKLAAKVLSSFERKVLPERQAREEEKTGRQEVEHLVTLAVVTGCVLAGGHGLNDAFVVGTRCTLRFTEEGLWVHPPEGWRALIRSPYSEATALEISGSGQKQSVGQIVGAVITSGGIPALWPIAHADIRTAIRYEAGQSLEAIFSCNTATPEELRAQLSEPLSRISTPPSSEPRVGSGTVGDLERLSELHKTRTLSDQEFAALKAKLIADL
jgi:hypothetical protein